MSLKLTRVIFTNYKALENYQITFRNTNILVGPNNCGKSTIIGAFRILEVALRLAGAKSPARVPHPSGYFMLGHSLSADNLPVSLENVHTNYSEDNSLIEFCFSNGTKLGLFFPSDKGCYLVWNGVSELIRTPSTFRKVFPYKIIVVPVLSTLEHEEPILNDQTVKAALGTHKASRHFRNYWHKNPEGFENFKNLVSETWPNMSLKKPEVDGRFINMFCSENRRDREIYWAGSGFQIWCQLLTHISRANDYDLCIVDEPEIYLHPEIQRQLLGILRDINPSIVLATHSTEILSDSDPSEILLIDKNKRAAQRLKDVDGIQLALSSLGSMQNLTLAQLARTKKVLFLEGPKDFPLIKKFANKLNLKNLSNGNGLAALESGGFGSWEKIKHFSWGMRILETGIKIAALYDRDYWPDEQVTSIYDLLNEQLDFVAILKRKEIENYLLIPAALERAIKNAVHSNGETYDDNIEELLFKISDKYHTDLMGIYLAKHSEFFASSKKDTTTLNREALCIFNEKWATLEGRMHLVSGKQVIKDLRTYLADRYFISLSDLKIIESIKTSEIPIDLKDMITALENFRQRP